MRIKLTPEEKYIINQIELGTLSKYLGSLVSYPEKRLQYTKRIAHLKELGIVTEMSGELIILSDNKYYKSQIIE